MPFGLKKAPSEFQKIMNDIFNPCTHYIIVYIDDVLIYSNNVEHFKHLNQFYNIAQHDGIVLSKRKMLLAQLMIICMGQNIESGFI